MADAITPTQPLTPSLPVTVDDKHHEKEKEPSHDKAQQQTDNNNPKKPKEGLFDDYA